MGTRPITKVPNNQTKCTGFLIKLFYGINFVRLIIEVNGKMDMKSIYMYTHIGILRKQNWMLKGKQNNAWSSYQQIIKEIPPRCFMRYLTR